eukprot:scaffold9861_cov118-Isochrysis_galbana.AAC.1
MAGPRTAEVATPNKAADTSATAPKASTPSVGSSLGSISRGPAPGTPDSTASRTRPSQTSGATPSGLRATSSHSATSCATRRFRSREADARSTSERDSSAKITRPAAPSSTSSSRVRTHRPWTTADGSLISPVRTACQRSRPTPRQLNVLTVSGSSGARVTRHRSTAASPASHSEVTGRHSASQLTPTRFSLPSAAHRVTDVLYPSNSRAQSACHRPLAAQYSSRLSGVPRSGPRYRNAGESAPGGSVVTSGCDCSQPCTRATPGCAASAEHGHGLSHSMRRSKWQMCAFTRMIPLGMFVGGGYFCLSSVLPSLLPLLPQEQTCVQHTAHSSQHGDARSIRSSLHTRPALHSFTFTASESHESDDTRHEPSHARRTHTERRARDRESC